MSKFTVFAIYSVERFLSKYIQGLSHMKRNGAQIPKLAIILTPVYTTQNLWVKKSFFNKDTQKSHIKLVSKKQKTTKDTA